MTIPNDKNELLALTPKVNLKEKVEFVKVLYSQSSDKINHLDQIRQRYLTLAFVAFSTVLAFISKSSDPLFQSLACLGVAILMIIFILLDNRLHKYTHGFRSSMYVFAKVIRDLLNEEEHKVEFYKYNACAFGKPV